MSVSESRRYRLYEVQARLDEEAAETLMELLPPVGWADVVTKHDLAHIDRRIGDVETRLTARIDGVEAQLTARIDGVEARLGAHIDGVEAQLTARIDDVETRLTARIDGVESRLGRLEERVDGLRSSFIGWILASQATVVAVVIGAAALTS